MRGDGARRFKLTANLLIFLAHLVLVTAAVAAPNTHGCWSALVPWLLIAGTPTLQRIERVNFDWGANAPGPGINNDGFSVRCSGEVAAISPVARRPRPQ